MNQNEAIDSGEYDIGEMLSDDDINNGEEQEDWDQIKSLFSGSASKKHGSSLIKGGRPVCKIKNLGGSAAKPKNNKRK